MKRLSPLEAVQQIHEDTIRVYNEENSYEKNLQVLLEIAQKHLFTFKRILDSQEDLDAFANKYFGFAVFSNFMDDFARATRDGVFEEEIKKSGLENLHSI